MSHKLLAVLFAVSILTACKKDDSNGAEKSVSGTYIGTTHLILESQYGSVHAYLDSIYTDSVAVISIPGDSIAIHNFESNSPYAFQWLVSDSNGYYASMGSHSRYRFSLYPQADSLFVHHLDYGGFGGNYTSISQDFGGTH